MRISDFRKWARRQLGDDGCGTVSTAISDDQLDQSLDNAKDWWNAFQGLHKEAFLNVVEDQPEYDLSGITPRVESVINVWFQDSVQLIDHRGLYPGFLDISGIPYEMSGFGSSNSVQTTIVQSLQSIESARRTFSADPDWEFVFDDTDELNPVRNLRMMPTPQETGTAVYLYRIDPRDIKLRMFKPRDLFLIREYALSEAKYILGRIRGKYVNGLPAAGSDRQLDGADLIAESIADKERLERKIIDYSGPVMPVIG